MQTIMALIYIRASIYHLSCTIWDQSAPEYLKDIAGITTICMQSGPSPPNLSAKPCRWLNYTEGVQRRFMDDSQLLQRHLMMPFVKLWEISTLCEKQNDK